eukprot:352230-Chlamydomonas_euryale.AAC.1
MCCFYTEERLPHTQLACLTHAHPPHSARADLLSPLPPRRVVTQYLGALNMVWCGGCGAFIDTDSEDGYTCTDCHGKFGKAGAGGRQHDLCVACFGSGRGEAHTAAEGASHQFVHMSDVSPPEAVTCVCCQREHSMVPGYMLGDEGDRHVRPVGDDPDAWVCELCALQSCKCGSALRWRRSGFMEGGLFHDLHMECQQPGGCQSLAAKQTPRGVFTAKSWARHAPHCKACRDMMLDGTMPWPAEPDETRPAGGAYTNGGAFPAAALAAAGGPHAGAGTGGLCRQAICCCCNDVHDLTSALDGRAVSGYLFGPGFPEHMKPLPNGLYLCEWCVRNRRVHMAPAAYSFSSFETCCLPPPSPLL